MLRVFGEKLEEPVRKERTEAGGMFRATPYMSV